MNETKNITIGVYETHADAELAIKELRAFGVPNGDISYLYTDAQGKVKDGQTGEKAGTGAAAGATTGAVLGALAGFVVANGVLPGLGTLFVAGPLAAALGFTGAAATTVAGAATGAAAGGLIGALAGLGVDREDAEMYEEQIRKGDVLVIVKSDLDGIADVLERTNAANVQGYFA